MTKTSDPPSRRGVSSVLAPRQESESAANRHVERVKKPLDDQSELARKPADGQTGKGTGRRTGGGNLEREARQQGPFRARQILEAFPQAELDDFGDQHGSAPGNQ